MSELIDTVARVIFVMTEEHGWGSPEHPRCVYIARRLVETIRDLKVIYREDGQVVHTLIGAPDDIWKTILDGALAE
jgi:hypothetical protein